LTVTGTRAPVTAPDLVTLAEIRRLPKIIVAELPESATPSGVVTAGKARAAVTEALGRTRRALRQAVILPASRRRIEAYCGLVAALRARGFSGPPRAVGEHEAAGAAPGRLAALPRVA
jgi:hypothetical protein